MRSKRVITNLPHKIYNLGAVPTFLLDRENTSSGKILSNMIKQKRKEKAGKN